LIVENPLLEASPMLKIQNNRKKFSRCILFTYSCFCSAYGIKEFAKNLTGKEPGARTGSRNLKSKIALRSDFRKILKIVNNFSL
jgi:hypothetical protein